MTIEAESEAESEELVEKMNNLKPKPKVKTPGEKPKDAMEKYLNETKVFERDCHLAEDERKAVEKLLPPDGDDLAGDSSEDNDWFSQIILDKFDIPNEDFNLCFRLRRNEIIPKGFHLMEKFGEKGKETHIMVTSLNFDRVYDIAPVDGSEFANIQMGMGFPITTTKEEFDQFPNETFFPLKTEDYGEGKFFWRIKLISAD